MKFEERMKPEFEGLQLDHRQVMQDADNGLGKLFNPHMDYTVIGKKRVGPKAEQGWQAVAEVGTIPDEDNLILMRREKKNARG